MEKIEIKVGDRIIPVEAGKVIPMTKEEWKKFQKQMKVERDYFYMVGNKKYVHYENEDYVRVSDIQQELDKAREEGYDQGVKDGMKGRVFKKVEITEEIHVPEEFLDKAREEGKQELVKEIRETIKEDMEITDTEDRHFQIDKDIVRILNDKKITKLFFDGRDDIGFDEGDLYGGWGWYS